MRIVNFYRDKIDTTIFKTTKNTDINIIGR